MQLKRREAKEQGLAVSGRRSCFGPKRKERETACVPGARPLTLALTLCSPGRWDSFGSPVLDPGKWVPWVVGVSVHSQC